MTVANSKIDSKVSTIMPPYAIHSTSVLNLRNRIPVCDCWLFSVVLILGMGLISFICSLVSILSWLISIWYCHYKMRSMNFQNNYSNTWTCGRSKWKGVFSGIICKSESRNSSSSHWRGKRGLSFFFPGVLCMNSHEMCLFLGSFLFMTVNNIRGQSPCSQHIQVIMNLREQEEYL